MHDGVNAFLSVRQPYIVDAARPPFVENEMDHELLRQHVQLASGSGRGTRHEPSWQEKERGQATMPFLSFSLEERWQRMMGKQRTREREGFSALSALSQARNFVSTRRGMWMTWRARQ